MKISRSVVLAAVALVVLSLSGAAGLLARSASMVPTLPARPSVPPPLLAKQASHVPDCSDQDDDDDDDDKAEVKKPDTDNVELQCGHQDDDDEIHPALHKAPTAAKPAIRK